jgi:hypothetical protein
MKVNLNLPALTEASSPTFHILTPYPDTLLYKRMAEQNRLVHSDWDLYDTRHVVYEPARVTADELERGYWHAYQRFYEWRSIFKGAAGKPTVAYAGGWKKLEPLWDAVIRAKRVTRMLPSLETILERFGRYRPKTSQVADAQVTSDVMADARAEHISKAM